MTCWNPKETKCNDDDDDDDDDDDMRAVIAGTQLTRLTFKSKEGDTPLSSNPAHRKPLQVRSCKSVCSTTIHAAAESGESREHQEQTSSLATRQRSEDELA